MDQEIYKSPVTGMSIRQCPTSTDWERILREEGKTSPHREVEVER